MTQQFRKRVGKKKVSKLRDILGFSINNNSFTENYKVLKIEVCSWICDRPFLSDKMGHNFNEHCDTLINYPGMRPCECAKAGE